jgi:outer membrane protein assembly factor BamB
MDIRKRLSDFRNWCPQPHNPVSTKLKKPIYAVFTVAVLAASFSVSMFFIYKPMLLPAPIFPQANQRGNVFWVAPMGDNIADYAVADGKVFAMTFHGYLQCFDQQSGAALWNRSLGGYTTWNYGQLIKVAYGKVYVGQPRESTLLCLDENNGSVIWQFAPNPSSSIASKSAPDFWVSDGKVLTTADNFYMLDAANGTLLWDSQNRPDVGFKALAFVDNQVLTVKMGNAPNYTISVASVDGDSGQVQWSTAIGTGIWPFSVATGDGKILLWGLYQNQTMFCLDEASGRLLWGHNVDGQVYQPNLSNGMVFFGNAQTNLFTKEYVSAIYDTNGNPYWSGELSGQNFTSNPQIIINTVDGKVYAGYSISESGNSQNVYEGSVYSYSQNGNLEWSTPISNNASAGGGLSSITSTGSDSLYVISSNDLYRMETASGIIDWEYTFNYWVLPPTYAYNKLFLAADLKIITFDPTSPPQDLAPTDLYFVSASQPDTILISGETQLFEVKVTVKNGGYTDANNVRLDFQPNFGNVSFVSTDVVNVTAGQESTIAAKLSATNTGQTHEANFQLNILYETPEGESKSLDGSGFSLAVVPVPALPFYATPLGIATIVAAALIVGIAVAVVFQKRKQARKQRNDLMLSRS